MTMLKTQLQSKKLMFAIKNIGGGGGGTMVLPSRSAVLRLLQILAALFLAVEGDLAVLYYYTCNPRVLNAQVRGRVSLALTLTLTLKP